MYELPSALVVQVAWVALKREIEFSGLWPLYALPLFFSDSIIQRNVFISSKVACEIDTNSVKDNCDVIAFYLDTIAW